MARCRWFPPQNDSITALVGTTCFFCDLNCGPVVRTKTGVKSKYILTINKFEQHNMCVL